MWEAAVAGRKLKFHLAGINNQNFVMQDEETGSWWQQVTGQAILGPLRGTQLRAVSYEETTFRLWRQEHPAGRVLRPEESLPWRRESAHWEAEVARIPVPAGSGGAAGPLAPRTLVLGVERNGTAKAYPLASVLRQSPLLDSLAGVPLALLAGEDGRTVRVFVARLEGRPLTLYAAPGRRSERWFDGETGSVWDFSGRALAGPWAGRALERVPALRDYWFDWRNYHPRSAVYRTLDSTGAAPPPISR